MRVRYGNRSVDEPRNLRAPVFRKQAFDGSSAPAEQKRPPRRNRSFHDVGRESGAKLKGERLFGNCREERNKDCRYQGRNREKPRSRERLIGQISKSHCRSRNAFSKENYDEKRREKNGSEL